MKCDLDLIISILHELEFNETNEQIVFTYRVIYNGKHYSIEDEKEFAKIYRNILCIRDYGLADVRVVERELAIAIEYIKPKGSRFLAKALILKAINQGYSSEKDITETLKLKQHTVNCHLKQLNDEEFIFSSKGFSMTGIGEHEYQSCVLTSKGKEALEDPNYLIEESNMSSNEYNFHAPVSSINNQGNYYEQSGSQGIGHMSGGKIKDGAKVAGVINEAQQQNLAEAAAEIQQLLEQLSQTYPTSTNKEKMTVVAEAVDQIESNPTLKARVINALKAGGTEAFKEAINHPLVNILIAAIEGWQEAG